MIAFGAESPSCLLDSQNGGEPSGAGELLFGVRRELSLFHVRYVAWPEPVGFAERLQTVGYDVRDRHLVVNQAEAATVREIFRRYQELGSVRLLKAELDRRGLRSKVRVANNGVRSGGHSFYRGALYTVLRNPIYIGQIRHKGVCHPGEHQAIVERDPWEQAQTLLSAHGVRGAARATKSAPCPLAAKLLFDERGERLTPSHAVKGARRYRYYVSRKLIQGSTDQAHRGWRLPAAEIERIVAAAARQMLDDQEAMLDAIQEMGIAANNIPAILHSANAWSGRLRSEAETSAVLSALVERVQLGQEGFRLALKLPTQLAQTAEAANHVSVAVSRFIPMQIKRRGVELRLVINGDRGNAQKADPALLKAIARAHRWFDDLVAGLQAANERSATNPLFSIERLTASPLDGDQSISHLFRRLEEFDPLVPSPCTDAFSEDIRRKALTQHRQ